MSSRTREVATVHQVCLRDSAQVLLKDSGRPQSQGSTRMPSKECSRELSRAEVRRLSGSMKTYFREACDINSRALGEEQMDAILSEVRLRRSATSGACGLRCPELAPPAVQDPCRGRKASKEAAPPPVEEVPGEVEKGEAPAPVQVRDPPKKRRSFMEQFGYGVRPKTPTEELEAPPAVVPRRPSNFACVDFKKNDLKERLAAKRRHTVQ